MVDILEIVQNIISKFITKYIKNILVLFIIFISFNNLNGNDNFDVRLKVIIYFDHEIQINTQLKHPYFNKVNKLPKHTSRPVIEITQLKDDLLHLSSPNFTSLTKIGKRISNSKRKELQNAKNALSVRFAYPKDILFSSLKKANKTIYNIAKKYNGLIWDIETKEILTAKQWRKKRLHKDIGKIPLVENHISINTFKKNKKNIAITLGMSKFGQPDILIKDYTITNHQAIKNLLNLISQSLIEGQKVSRNLNIDLNMISNKDFINRIFQIRKDKNLNISIPIAMGHWEEDFSNNYIIEILFDHIKGKSLKEKQRKLISEIFGLEDEIFEIEYDKIIHKYINSPKQKESEKLNEIDPHNITSLSFY